MAGRSSADDLGAKLMRELIFSRGTSAGDTNPGERLLRQARNLHRDGIPALSEAAGRGLVSVADAERLSRFDAETQKRALSGDLKAFVRQLKTRENKADQGEPKSCLKCRIAESIALLLKSVPDDKLDGAICQVMAELARVREARLPTKNSPKPALRARKVAKTLGFSESATLPMEHF